jgi:hypothetical protein
VYQHEYALTKITCMRGDMAAPKFTSRELEGVYRLLVALNSSLQFIVLRLEEMAGNKLFNPTYLKEMTALTQEVKATLDRLTQQ